MHQCPGPLPGNTTHAGINITCVACPVILTNLTTSQLIAEGLLKPGQFHYNPATGTYNYLDANGVVQTIPTSAQLAAIIATIPTPAQIAALVAASLTSTNILNLIDCTALKAKCGFLQAGDIAAFVTAGAGITVTPGANGSVVVSLSGGGAAPNLTAAQIANAFANVACVDLSAALDRCGLCPDVPSTAFWTVGSNSLGGSQYTHGNFRVSGDSTLPASVMFEVAGSPAVSVNTTPIFAGSSNKIALYTWLTSGTREQGEVFCRYSLDGGTTWSAYISESAVYAPI
jgi:hypothetical protein